MGLAHGDIQPQHILVDDDGHACLGNIGHATINREKGDTKLGPASVRANDAGNTRYRPPEHFADEPGSKYPGDIYSMGMTIYEVLTGKKPFPDHSSTSVVTEITNGKRPGKPNFILTPGYTDELWKLTEDCWKPKPAERPTVDKLLERLQRASEQWKPFEL